MKIRKLHTPDGVKDMLPYEYEFKKEMESKVESVFHGYGYLSLTSPTFEYIDVFQGKGSVIDSYIFKFIDRDGETLALRADMTPAIARIAATSYDEKDMPLRFCYMENAYRHSESYQGKVREYTQAGVELIGDSGDEGTAETIAVAIQSLLALDIEEFRIDIGSVKFFKEIIKEAGLEKYEEGRLQEYILDKDFVAAEEIIEKYCKNNWTKDLFKELPFLMGSKEVIEKAKTIIKSDKVLEALHNLEEIYNILEDYGLAKYIYFDLSMIGQLDYYTDIIFKGYVYDTPSSIITGGRYDKLLSNFGTGYEAVGFAIKMNMLMLAIIDWRSDYKKPNKKADTLLVYTKEGRKTAYSTANELRKDGLLIQNSFIQGNIDKNIEYAKANDINGILFFKDDDTAEVINLIDNTKKEVNISDLLNSY